jgi:hypothetical protein
MNTKELHEKIAVFLRSKKPESFCADCIASEVWADVVAVRAEIHKISAQIEFLNAGAPCVRCEAKPAVRAA